MGGEAFARAFAEGEPTLATPRMSPTEYGRLKDLYLKKLQEYFNEGKVTCMTEAPEKADYGDIDIFVATDERIDFINMANDLGAVAIIVHALKEAQKSTIAVRKDGTASTRPVVQYKHAHGGMMPSSVLSRPDYAQVDIEIIEPELLDWYAFYSSYGDMVGLIGHIVTNLGFRATDRGLWLRMEELDLAKASGEPTIPDNDGSLLLSTDPRQVMQFLGLSVSDYEAGFETLEGLYEWLGKCRLLSAEALKIKRNKAHERNREKKRTVFSKFFNEWLPAHMEMDVVKESERQIEIVLNLREKYLQDALDYFAKRGEYDIKHQALVKKLNIAIAGNLLKPLLARHSGRTDKHLTEIVRAFRRWIGIDVHGQPCILDSRRSDDCSELDLLLADNGNAFRHPLAVSEWVEKNWEEVRSLETQWKKSMPEAD